MCQEISASPPLSIDDAVLEVTYHFIYLSSTIADNLSLDMEIDKRIFKVAAVIAKLSKRV